MDTVPAYVDWRACTATPLSGLADYKIRLKLPPLNPGISKIELVYSVQYTYLFTNISVYSHLCSESMVTSPPGRSVLGRAPGTPPRGPAAPAGRSSGQTQPAQPHPTSPHTCTMSTHAVMNTVLKTSLSSL